MSGSLVMPLLRNEIFFHAVNRIEVEKKKHAFQSIFPREKPVGKNGGRGRLFRPAPFSPCQLQFIRLEK